MMDQNVKRAILMDHYRWPHNHGLVDDDRYQTKHMTSSSCIDDIKVQMLFENDYIKDIRFDAYACTVSIASTSIFTDLLKGKTKQEALKIIDEYLEMLSDGKGREELGEANAFDSLYLQPNRLNCGMIGVKAMKELIEESES